MECTHYAQKACKNQPFRFVGIKSPKPFQCRLMRLLVKSSRILVLLRLAKYQSSIMLVSIKYHALNTLKILIIRLLIFVSLECLPDICKRFPIDGLQAAMREHRQSKGECLQIPPKPPNQNKIKKWKKAKYYRNLLN